MAHIDTAARHIVCVVQARPETREEVIRLLLDLVGPARAEEGCLYYDINQQVDHPDTFRIVDGWKSQEAIEAHVKHPNVAKVVEQLFPLLASPLELSTSVRISES
jgi:quinol monooxygenase YgiN